MRIDFLGGICYSYFLGIYDKTKQISRWNDMKRRTGYLITLLIIIGLILLYALVVSPGIRLGKRSVLVIPLRGELTEQGPLNVVEQMAMGKVIVVADVVSALDIARDDPKIKGAVIKISPLISGFAKIEEIRDAVIRFRQGDKFAYAYLIQPGTTEYFLAAAADKVYLAPTDELKLTGIAYEVLFMRGFFDLIGVVPEIDRIGRYKSAADVLTRRRMSRAHREMEEAIISSQFSLLVSAIGKGRGIAEDEVKRLIDEAPLLAEEAKERGLIDEAIYPDELRSVMEKKLKGKPRLVNFSNYLKARSSTPIGIKKKVALIYALGTINIGESSFVPFMGRIMGSETISRQVREVAEDSEIKAIILRVDSPGGSAVASDLIWRELALAKKKKPVIISMSDVAASGGYYIACPGSKIVSNSATLTGSIGVLSGKFDLSRLYQRLGMNKELVSRGEKSAMYSDYRRFTPEERKALEKSVRGIYRNFITRVGEGRGMKTEEVDKIGRGRVYTGIQAKDIGLVDEIGGLYRAIELAKKEAGIPVEEKVELVIYPRKKGFWESFFELTEGGAGLFREGFGVKLPPSINSLARESIFLFPLYSVKTER
jgi:protease-4